MYREYSTRSQRPEAIGEWISDIRPLVTGSTGSLVGVASAVYYSRWHNPQKFDWAWTSQDIRISLV